MCAFLQATSRNRKEKRGERPQGVDNAWEVLSTSHKVELNYIIVINISCQKVELEMFHVCGIA